MSWEHPKRGGPYYTRSRRVNGRVVREYFGKGEGARDAYEEDLERREERQRRRAAWQGEVVSLEDTDQSAATFGQAAELLVQATLYVAGYHLHKRGEWRRW